MNKLKTPFSQTQLRTNERGGALVLVALAIVVLIQMTSLAVDIGMAYVQQRRIQIATDAAALSAVALYSSAPQTVNDIEQAEALLIPAAREIALANGLKEEEINNGQSIVVGNWDSQRRIFSPRTTPLNSVRITAFRNVPAYFARIMGIDWLRPQVGSTAKIGATAAATCLIPFGINDDLLIGKQYGDIIDISSPSPGNWGKIDIDGNMSSLPVFVEAMKNGICNVKVDNGDVFNLGTGFAGVRDGFDQRIAANPIVLIPVVDDFGNGDSQTTSIVGFIVAKLLMHGSQGKNWSGEIQLLDQDAGTGSSGALIPPYAKARVLVE